MVKRSRRMTVAKKKFGGKKTKSSMKPTKGKQLARSSKKRPAAKTDRANNATKVLLKALKKKEE